MRYNGSKRTCQVDGCSAHVESQDLCGKHYQRFKRWGDPLYVAPSRKLPPFTGDRRTCTGCHIEKPIDAFQKIKTHGDGFKTKCRECLITYAREWYRRNKPERRRLARERYDPVRSKNYDLWQRYRMRPDEYASILESQNGECPTCHALPHPVRGLDVDHDHSCCEGPYSCGKCVRGILCRSCNSVLGFVNDNIETLQALIEYLTKHKELRESK